MTLYKNNNNKTRKLCSMEVTRSYPDLKITGVDSENCRCADRHLRPGRQKQRWKEGVTWYMSSQILEGEDPQQQIMQEPRWGKGILHSNNYLFWLSWNHNSMRFTQSPLNCYSYYKEAGLNFSLLLLFFFLYLIHLPVFC